MTHLRLLCGMVIVGGFFMIGMALYFSSMALEFARSLPDASRTYGCVSGAWGMAGMLIGFGGMALAKIVARIDALETILAKFAESEDLKTAARDLAKFLRKGKNIV